MTRLRPAVHDGREDAGSAIVEFVFVAVVVMIPLVYFLATVAVVQRNRLAVSQAAREAGRAYATSDRAGDTEARVRAAVRIALADQGVPDDASVTVVAAAAGCGSAEIVPRLTAGAEFAICVSRRVTLPAVPSVLSGRGITTVGRYVVHVDDYRTVLP